MSRLEKVCNFLVDVRNVVNVNRWLTVMDLDVEKHAFGAQLSLLHRLTTTASKMLRRRASLLLIAKLLTIARLLYKTLSQQNSAQTFLDSLRVQLTSLRKSLARRTNRRLASTNVGVDDMIESLAAYCLDTSSSSDDAVRHFHQIRIEVIVSTLDSESLSGEDVLKALRLYVETLKTSKVLLSRRLGDALGKLKNHPILDDSDIRDLDDLDIDILGRWVAPGVKNFTPWIKLSELTRPEAEKVIKQWSSSAFRSFIDGTRKGLNGWDDFSQVLSLRQKTLETWLSWKGSITTHSPLGVLEDIRGLFNGQLTRVLHAQGKTLDEISRDISSVAANWESSRRQGMQSLWDPDLISLDYSNGAANFKQAVVGRFLGWDEGISSEVKRYETWIESLQNSQGLIENMRRVKWIDFLDEDGDEDLSVDVTSILNEDDPQTLSEALRTAVQQAYYGLQSSFQEIASSLGSSNASQKAGYLLRLIRQIRSDVPLHLMPEDFVFSSDIVPQLQKIIADDVATNTGPLTVSSVINSRGKQVPGRSLWEGDPALPIQPLPCTFKFLRRLMTSMERCGSDLCDSSTLVVVKSTLSDKLSTTIMSVFEDLQSTNSSERNVSEGANGGSTEEENHNPENPSQGEILCEQKTQLLFDTVYLASALATNAEKTELTPVIDKLESDAESQGIAVKHVKRLAIGYWQRTSLLFGLLASEY